MSVAGGRRTPMRPGGGGQRLATLETQAFLYPDSSPHLVGWRQAAPYPHNTAPPTKALPDQKGWLSWGVMRPKVPSTHMQYANFQAQSAVRRMVSPQLDYRRPGGLGEWRPKTPPCPAPSVLQPPRTPPRCQSSSTDYSGMPPDTQMLDERWISDVLMGYSAAKQGNCLRKLRAARMETVQQLHSLHEEDWASMQLPMALKITLQLSCKEAVEAARKLPPPMTPPPITKPWHAKPKSVMEKFCQRLKAADSAYFQQTSVPGRPRDWLRNDVDFQLLASVADCDDDGVIDTDEYGSGIRTVNEYKAKINQSSGYGGYSGVQMGLDLGVNHEEQRERQQARAYEESMMQGSNAL